MKSKIPHTWEYDGHAPSDHVANELDNLLDEIVFIEEDYFGTKTLPLTLANRPDCPKAPITYRDRQEIYVNCPQFYPPRFAFQFTHEICHYLIPGKVDDPLRWLEESVAVLASRYFSLMLTSTDKKSLEDYIELAFHDAKPLKIEDLKSPNSEILRNLETCPDHDNYTDYGKYMTIALHMLPTVEANPLFWRAVPKLSSVEPAQDLAGSLGCWLDLVEPSDVHDALAKVISTLL